MADKTLPVSSTRIEVDNDAVLLYRTLTKWLSIVFISRSSNSAHTDHDCLKSSRNSRYSALAKKCSRQIDERYIQGGSKKVSCCTVITAYFF